MTDAPPMRIDHVGIAVESIADAERLLFVLGAEKVHAETTDETFTWATYRLGDASRFELLEPVDGTDSFLTDFLERRGPGPHHVTLEVTDLDAAVDALETADFPTVEYREYDDWTEVFVSPRNPTGTLIQLMEYHDSYSPRGDAGPADLFVGGDPL